MQKLLASVIVPTLNEEKFVAKTLKVLSEQSVPRSSYEIIVSDSSSHDNTVRVAKKYADKVVVCKRVSAGFGRNFGAKHARSPIIGFVDADTIVSKQWVEGLIEGCSKGIACTGPMASLERDSIKLALFFDMWNLQTWFSILIRMPLIPGFNFGVRKKEFEKVGGFKNSNITTEDIDLSVRLSPLGKPVFVGKMSVKTSNRRLRGESVIDYILNGPRYFLFGKSRTWNERRKDFAVKKP